MQVNTQPCVLQISYGPWENSLAALSLNIFIYVIALESSLWDSQSDCKAKVWWWQSLSIPKQTQKCSKMFFISFIFEILII